MTIAKRILSMVAALSMISNNSAALGMMPSLIESGLNDRMHGENASDNDKSATDGEDKAGDETPTDNEDKEPTKEEDTTKEEDITKEEEVPEKEPPTLDVRTGKGTDSWVSDLEDWSVTAYGDGDNGGEEPEIYYEICEAGTDPLKHSRCKQNRFITTKDLPAGDHYVFFYTCWPNCSRINVTNECYHYMLDDKDPDSFNLSINRKELKVETSDITDAYSGIGELYYTYGFMCKDHKDLKKRGTKITNVVNVPTNDGRSVMRAEIPIIPDMNGKRMYVYALDNTGRYTIAEKKISDTDIPLLESNGAVNVYKGVESAAVSQTYGSDHSAEYPLTDHTYVCDNSYLKVRLQDQNFKDCELTVSWKEDGNTKEKKFKASELTAPQGIDAPYGTLYIPFSALGLTDCRAYTFTIGATDGTFDATPVIERATYYYSKSDGYDARADIKIVNKYVKGSEIGSKQYAYLFEKEKGNKLEYIVSDDVGIAEYTVTVTKDGKVCENYPVSENLTAGREVKDEVCGSTIIYRIPVKKTEKAEIDLPEDGTYIVEIKVRDIEGNVREYSYSLVVDTEAPEITKSTYEVKPEDRINYYKYGIYSNTALDFFIKANDKLSGVDNDQVRLYIEDDDGDRREYKGKPYNGGYIFEKVEPNIDGKAYIVVKDKLGNDVTYYFTNDDDNDGKMTGARLSTDDNGVKYVYDNVPPEFTVKAEGSVQNDYPVKAADTKKNSFSDKKADTEKKVNVQFFGAGDDNALVFSFSDDKGLKDQKIVIYNEKGDVVSDSSKEYIRGENVVTSDEMGKIIKIPKNLPEGKYTIKTEVTDLAGTTTNISKTGLVSKDGSGNDYFIVDRTAPIIKNVEYSVDKGSLNYLLHGIYGKNNIDISIDVQDNENGCGVESAELCIDGRSICSAEIDGTTGKMVFRNVRPDLIGYPYIVVKDHLGNTNHYVFTASSPAQNEDMLKLTGVNEEGMPKDNGVLLVLENYSPYVHLTVDENYKYVDPKGNHWYSGDVPYKVVAYDTDIPVSGLRSVSVTDDISGNDVLTANEYNGKSFKDGRYFKNDPEYNGKVSQEGHYKLVAKAEDNAGNTATESAEFFIDKKTPEITSFTLSSAVENAPFIHNESYGYFFETDVTARVYVSDPDFSSGIRSVTLYTNEVGGNAVTLSMDASMLKQDENGTYAEFVVHKGFKGHIAAKVTDNVGLSSDTQAPDGTVIEDSQLHSEHASITITPLGTPVNGFYNHPLALNVTVKDSFSGIADIDWSIGKDNKSGQLNTSVEDGSLTSTVDVGQQVTATDANLVTEVTFRLMVESDENDNPVNISMTDNAGNTLNASAMYSLDLTAPVVSTSLSNNKSKNGIYYDADQSVNFTILERNFNAADAKVMVNGVEQKVSWQNGEGAGNNTPHTAKLDLKEDGDYTVTVQYTDLAGNPGTYDAGQHFIIDKTKPVITNNFADFKTGTPDDISGSTELYYNNEDGRRASFEVDVTEKNFDESDLHIAVYSKAPGSAHEESGEEWRETRPEFTWTHDEKNDDHKLTFDLNEDSVYKIEIKPEDRAGNSGDIEEGSDSKTDIFEVDTTAPVIGARNEGDYAELTDDGYNALAVYDIDRFEDEAPFVEFEDTNLYRLEYELTTFKPEYSDGREIGKIVPEESSADKKDDDYAKDKALEINKSEEALAQDTIKFTLPDFEEDGVYSVTMYAVDMAGNKSEISDNTYVRIMNTPLLAYIENSNKEEGTGWYSFEDEEYGPISKQPTSFEDLDIVMFSKTGTSPKLLLVDKDTEAETDTGATAIGEKMIDDDMYMVNARRYNLPGGYFSANFTEDVDTRLYLRAENDGEYIDLGEMYIDNTKPECAVPNYLKNWGWLKGSGEQTITFSNISEVLDDGETVVYINGEEITPDGNKISVDGKDVSAAYNVENDSLSLTLPTGTYSIGAKLVDKAGNMRIITEVDHFAVGNTRIWYVVGGASALLLTIGGITAVVRKRRRKIN